MTTLRLMRVHWFKWGLTGTACGSGGVGSDVTTDATCRECIQFAAADDRRVRISKEARAAADPWQAVREKGTGS